MSTLKVLVLTAVLMTGFTAANAYSAEPAKPAPADPKKKDPKDMNADEANDAGLCPVCKGEFKPVYHYEYKGKEYHFKTRQCQKDFAADPTKFGAQGEAADKKDAPKPK